jgi:hypothetical protein
MTSSSLEFCVRNETGRQIQNRAHDGWDQLRPLPQVRTLALRALHWTAAAGEAISALPLSPFGDGGVRVAGPISPFGDGGPTATVPLSPFGDGGTEAKAPLLPFGDGGVKRDGHSWPLSADWGNRERIEEAGHSYRIRRGH